MLQELETKIITKHIDLEEEEQIEIENKNAYKAMVEDTVSAFSKEQLLDLEAYIHLEKVADGSHIVDDRGVAMPDLDLWNRFDNHRLEMISRYTDGDINKFIIWLDHVPISNSDIRREILKQASEKNNS